MQKSRVNNCSVLLNQKKQTPTSASAAVGALLKQEEKT